MKTPTRRNLPKILRLYRAIVAYKEKFNEPPTMQQLMDMGFAASAAVISYYYDELEELGMAKRTPTRRISPLPLAQAHPSIRKLLESEDE